MTSTPTISRCAIYTRKSSEHNLDLAFNSLDAQREACEAYIKSQTHEGWRLVADHYDDGGISGATLDRPDVQRLLKDIAAGKIDIVVVYKVDRLTRSLADFAKLVDIFDRHKVSFVSVTQAFNTTSSMGRLTLNVLLSFAQFEREVIGERVRDKISASKRKGIWVGGPVPLGYEALNKKVVIIPEEAETVRSIFRWYLEFGSIGLLKQELDRRGFRTKRKRLSTGREIGGDTFLMSGLNHLLQNRFYVGEIFYREEIFSGDHEPILERSLFEAVQAQLAKNNVAKNLSIRGKPAILTGRIYDDRGNRMTPSHSNKRGVRYRYYVSMALLQRQKSEAGTVSRVAAPEIEELVLGALRKRFKCSSGGEPEFADREVIDAQVERIVIKQRSIIITLLNYSSGSPTEDRGNREGETIEVLWDAPSFAYLKGEVHVPSETSSLKAETRDALLSAIAKARGWVQDLSEGKVPSFRDIAAREGKCERHIRLLAPLAYVAPETLRSIVNQTADTSMTVTGLAKTQKLKWFLYGG